MQKNSVENNIDISEMKNAELIEELHSLNDEQKSELSGLYEDVFDKFRVGKIITGTIVSKDNSGVIVDIEYKSNGHITSHEFSDYELKKLKVGDEIEVLLDKLEDENGNVVLSYQKAKSLRAWDKLTELAEKNEPVSGVVTNKVKGGLSVDIGLPAFLPGSQVDVQRVVDFDRFVGQEIDCYILKINKKRGNVIVSRRKFLEQQRDVDKKKALEVLEQDQVIQGVVKNITNYGVFVDIGGIDGLLHITDMSWRRISHPSEMVKIGDTITVKIISFDKKNEKISLGMKQLEENPWENVDGKYKVGDVVKGKITSITDYGLFVEVSKGIEGLVHISEVSWTERIVNLSKHFKIGQEIEVSIVDVDKEHRRMSLSVKQLQKDPWKVVAEKFKVGDKISGPISNITDFGMFIRLYDGVDGLVHISDISWTEHIMHPTDKYKKGDDVEAVILAIEPENKKISLGIKQLEEDPWENIVKEYPAGKVVEGTVSKITNFGAFIKLPTGVEGLVHISEIDDKEVEKIEDVLQIGQKENFKVIKVSKEDRKLGLSLRAAKKGASDSSEQPKEVKRTSEHKAKSSHEDSKYKKAANTKTIMQQAFEELNKRKEEDSESSEDDKE